MPTFDGANLTITLDPGVTSVDVIADIFSPWKDWMLASPENRKYPQAFRSDGGNPLTALIDQGAYIFLQNQYGWRIKPPEEDITVYLTGNLAVEDATLPAFIPTTGAFTAAILGLQPVTQGVSQTLIERLDYDSYNEGVTYDTTNGDTLANYELAGVAIGGSSQFPLNNWADSVAVMTEQSFDKVYLKSDFVIGATDDVGGIFFYGKGASLNTTLTDVTITAGAVTSRANFYEVRIAGYQGGEGLYHQCAINGIDNAHCVYDQCALLDGTALGYTIRQSTGPGNTHSTYLRECFSDEGQAIIDRNNARMSMFFDRFHGNIKFINMNHADVGPVRIHMNGGEIEIDSSCTTGTIYVTGDYTIINNTGGTEVRSGILQTINNVRASVESIHLTHPALGHTIWVDHEAGSDTASGDSERTAVQSFAAALALADAGDAIQVVPPQTYGFVHREDILINKNNIHIRGAGRALVYKPQTNGEAVLQVGDVTGLNGYECSFRAMLLDGDRGAGTASSVNVIKMYGKFTLMSGMWAKQSEGSLCKIYGGDYHRFDTCEFEKSDLHIIETEDLDLPSGSPREIEFRGLNNFYIAGGDIIHLGADLGELGSTTRIINILGGNLHTATGFAVYADADVDKLLIGNDVMIHGCNGGHGFPQTNILTVEYHDDREEAIDRMYEHAVDGTYTFEEVMRLIASALAGKVSGAGTGTETFRDLSDTKNRIVSTVDQDGNRTAVTLDGT